MRAERAICLRPGCGLPVRRAGDKYCGKACAYAMQRRPRDPCALCGDPVKELGNTYCSRACAVVAQQRKRPERHCAVCGKALGRFQRNCCSRQHASMLGRVRRDDCWTQAMDNTLRLLWDEGMTTAEIARRLDAGKSTSAVIGRAHRLDLAGRPSPIIRDGRPPRVRGKPPVTLAPLVSAGTIHIPTRTRDPSVVPARRLPPQENPAAPVSPYRLCQFPTGSGKSLRFCLAPTLAGYPYCLAHCRICYNDFDRRRRERGMVAEAAE